MSAPAETARAQVVELLSSQMFAVLATQQGDQPHLSLMAFAASADVRRLIFITERETRKFANLLANPRTAMLVDNRSNQAVDLSGALALTAVGPAKELDGEARSEALDLFLTKHPGLMSLAVSSRYAVVEVSVAVYYLVSEFDEVEVVHP